MSNRSAAGELSAPSATRTTPTNHLGQVSLVIPSRNEADNIEPLLDGLASEFVDFDFEVVLVDDSDDDTAEVARRAGRERDLRVRAIHRQPHQRAGGLGTAVLRGFEAAASPWALVMDADLQHPPEAASAVATKAVTNDLDLVVGSRYVGEGAADGLSPTRRYLSGSARLLARALFPMRLASVSDPLSGMFAVRLDAIDLDRLDPNGFKILVELLLSQDPLRAGEVGYQFAERTHGDSKATSGELLAYLSLLVRRRLSASQSSSSTRTTRLGAPVGS